MTPDRHRKREARLMTRGAIAAAIAGEIRQPLSAMMLNAAAGLHWLERSTPDLDEAKAAFRQIAADGHRAVLSIRSSQSDAD